MSHVMQNGYVSVYRADHPRASASGAVYEHVLVVERALGRFLKNEEQVHHVNGDKTDNRNRNLVACEDMAYHKLLHVRAKVLKAGGDPNAQRLCSACRRLKSFQEFNRMVANKSDGRQRRCRDCQGRLYKGYVRPSRRSIAA